MSKLYLHKHQKGKSFAANSARNIIKQKWADKIAQLLKILPSKSDDLTSVLNPQVEKEKINIGYTNMCHCTNLHTDRDIQSYRYTIKMIK